MATLHLLDIGRRRARRTGHHGIAGAPHLAAVSSLPTSTLLRVSSVRPTPPTSLISSLTNSQVMSRAGSKIIRQTALRVYVIELESQCDSVEDRESETANMSELGASDAEGTLAGGDGGRPGPLCLRTFGFLRRQRRGSRTAPGGGVKASRRTRVGRAPCDCIPRALQTSLEEEKERGGGTNGRAGGGAMAMADRRAPASELASAMTIAVIIVLPRGAGAVSQSPTQTPTVPYAYPSPPCPTPTPPVYHAPHTSHRALSRRPRPRPRPHQTTTPSPIHHHLTTIHKHPALTSTSHSFTTYDSPTSSHPRLVAHASRASLTTPTGAVYGAPPKVRASVRVCAC